MLDDLDVINVLDAADMVGVAQNSHKQLKHSFKSSVKRIKIDSIANIVYMGMGGSALAAVLFESWQRNDLVIPFSYYREYDVPGWVDENTLVIVSSYSGNTEEALSAYIHAHEKGAQVVVFAHGGELYDEALRFKDPLFDIPEVVQPRMSVFYMLRALSEISDHIGATHGLVTNLKSAASGLAKSTEGWRKDVGEEFNLAKQLAVRCKDKTVVIMGGPLMAAAAYKWKISINESSKNMAFYSVWPEYNHNEFLGWSLAPEHKPFVIFQLVSEFESPRIHQRFEVSNKLLAEKIPEPIIIEGYGETDIEQLLWMVSLGDHVSTYLAFLNNVNPEPVTLIEDLKKELNSQDPNSKKIEIQ